MRSVFSMILALCIMAISITLFYYNQDSLTKVSSKYSYLNTDIADTFFETQFPSKYEPEASPIETSVDNSYQEATQSEDYLRVILSPLHRATLSSEVVITSVQEINKKMGESFKKGDLLIKLDDAIFLGLLRKAEGNFEKAKAEVNAKRQLYQEEISSLFELKSSEADLATAESDIISAEHAIKACTILAPYDGKVDNVFVEEHELVQQGKPLIEIIDDAFLIGKVLVPSSMLSRLALDKEVKIKIRDTNTVVTGKILRIDSIIDPSSSMLKLDLVVDNKNGQLRSGMIGIVRIL